jgi:glycosyltransferase involved in cell wall biosynthesis
MGAANRRPGPRHGADKMRIAFLYYYTYRLPRGVETLIASLANALARRGVEVAIVTARPTLEPLVPPDPAVRVYAYPTVRYFEHVCIVPYFVWNLLRHPYDRVVVFYGDFGEGLAWRILRMLRRAPPLVLYLCSPYSAVPHRYRTFLELGWGEQAHSILADAGWVAREAEELFRRPVAVVPVATDPRQFRPDAALRKETRLRLGYSDSEVVLLNVSALEPRKGVTRVIEAMARLKDRFPHLRYYILGKGDEEAGLRRQVEQEGLHGRVAFGGVTADLEAYYNMADIFVMLPDSEANSVACHEAMSSGLPVVVSRKEGFLDSVSSGAGLLVDPEQPQEVDAALGRLIASAELRASMGREGRASILASGNWSHRARQFLEIVA